jgi:hypothetical protein
MKDEINTAIKAIVKKVKNSNDSTDALKLSQSALNLAHTLATFDNIGKSQLTVANK